MNLWNDLNMLDDGVIGCGDLLVWYYFWDLVFDIMCIIDLVVFRKIFWELVGGNLFILFYFIKLIQVNCFGNGIIVIYRDVFVGIFVGNMLLWLCLVRVVWGLL